MKNVLCLPGLHFGQLQTGPIHSLESQLHVKGVSSRQLPCSLQPCNFIHWSHNAPVHPKSQLITQIVGIMRSIDFKTQNNLHSYNHNSFFYIIYLHTFSWNGTRSMNTSSLTYSCKEVNVFQLRMKFMIEHKENHTYTKKPKRKLINIWPFTFIA